MKKILFALPVALAACMQPETGAISAYNGDSVSIQTPGTSALMRPLPQTQELAEQTCEGARYASTRRVGQYTVEFLFICP